MPAPASGNFAQCHFKLKAAVAAQRTEDVSGEALGVDADEGRRGVNVAHDEGDQALDFAALRGRARRRVACLLSRQRSLKAEDAEGSPASGEVGFGDLLHAHKWHESILLCGDWHGRDVSYGMELREAEGRLERAFPPGPKPVLKSESHLRGVRSGAKAPIQFAATTARLKSCPFKTLAMREFYAMPGSSVLSKPLFSAVSQGARDSRRGAIHWWGDGQSDSDYAAGEAGRGCLGGQRAGARPHIPAAVLCRASPSRQTLALLAFFLVPLTLGVWIGTCGAQLSGRRHFI